MKEKIVCSAVHFDNGKKDLKHQPENIDSGFVIAGMRHCNCFGTILAISNIETYDPVKQTQGFITSFNRFVDREEGAKIAKKAWQIRKKTMYLFSEDLW